MLILPGYFPPHIGGLETHVDEFAKYLSQDPAFEVSILAPNIPQVSSFEIRYGRVKVFRYPAFELIPNYPVPKLWSRDFWRFFSWAYRTDFDIIMTRTRFFASSLLGLILAKLRRKKRFLLHVEHGSSYVVLTSRIKSGLAHLYDKIFGKLLFRKADLVIAISEAVRTFVEEHFLPGPIPVIRRGIEIEAIASVPPAQWVIRHYEDRFRIGFVGRFFRWKGVANLIQAYFLLPEELRKQTVLFMVGYGEDEMRLKDLAGEALGEGIVFTGRVPFEEAIALTKTFDVYVHPSGPGGGLATSLLQAMACGCAIVASPHEGAEELIIDGETGLLLPDNRPESLAKGMEYFFRHPEARDEFGKAAHAFVKDNFSWERQIAKFKQLLREHFLR